VLSRVLKNGSAFSRQRDVATLATIARQRLTVAMIPPLHSLVKYDQPVLVSYARANDTSTPCFRLSPRRAK
jgi:hypothetical protein